MPKCYHCARRLGSWQLKCRTCHFRTWRLPHYALSVGLILIAVFVLLFLITYETQ